jgi:hypothetical protein
MGEWKPSFEGEWVMRFGFMKRRWYQKSPPHVVFWSYALAFFVTCGVIVLVHTIG